MRGPPAIGRLSQQLPSLSSGGFFSRGACLWGAVVGSWASPPGSICPVRSAAQQQRLGEAAPLLGHTSPLPTGACAFQPDKFPEGPSKWPQPMALLLPSGPAGSPPQATATWGALPVLPPAGTSDLPTPSPSWKVSGPVRQLAESRRRAPTGDRARTLLHPSLTRSPRALLCPFLLPSPSVLGLG